MSVANYNGPGNIEAKGGDGGTENDGGNIGRCYGAGGGGSGGAIYFSGSTPPITVSANGGNAGPELSRDASCAAAVLPGSGTAGQVIQNYSYARSSTLQSNYCSYLLPVELAWFSAVYSGGRVVLNWKAMQSGSVEHFVIERSGDRNQWTQLQQLPASDGFLSYQYVDHEPGAGYVFYRIRTDRRTGSRTYSPIQRVYVPGGDQSVVIYPNPASKKLYVKGLAAAADLSIFDISGKLICRRKLPPGQMNAPIELPSLTPGLYIVRIGDSVNKLIIH
jgi:hypothetical protein